MVYGGAYQVEFHGRKGTFPAMPDLPFLGVVGDRDRDVGFMGSMWLSHHVGQQRRQPALMAVVPGLGHTYVNRALSARRIDDRVCDGDCPGARAHERFLISTAQRWFDATLRHERSDVPMRGMSALPDRLSGLPVRWLAVTNGPRTIAYLAGRTGTFRTFGPLGRARTCYPLEELAPIQRGDCPLPARAVTQNAAAVTQVRLAPRSGVRLGTPPTTGVSGIVLHLSPSDDRTIGTRATRSWSSCTLPTAAAFASTFAATHRRWPIARRRRRPACTRPAPCGWRCLAACAHARSSR